MRTQSSTIYGAKRAMALLAHCRALLGASFPHPRLPVAVIAVLSSVTMLSTPASAACAASRTGRQGLRMPAGLVVGQLTASDNQPKGTGSASLVGLWHVKFVSDGQLYDEGFDQFHADGTEILNDDGVPPAEGNVCLGVYKKIGHRTYQLKHPAFVWDGSGGLIGTLIIREAITLDPGRNSYHGSFVFDFYDLAGNLTDEVKGDLSGERIVVN